MSIGSNDVKRDSDMIGVASGDFGKVFCYLQNFCRSRTEKICFIMLGVGWKKEKKNSSLPVEKVQCSRHAAVAKSVLALKPLLESKLASLPKPTRSMITM